MLCANEPTPRIIADDAPRCGFEILRAMIEVPLRRNVSHGNRGRSCATPSSPRLCPPDLLPWVFVSFVSEFNSLPVAVAGADSRWRPAAAAVRESLAKPRLSLADFAHLISPAAAELLEHMGRRSHAMTQQRFGKVIRLFAPLYLSNECINNCQYCGFSRDNPILRVTLSLDEVKREARALKDTGLPQHPARRGRTSEICLATIICADCIARAARRMAGHLARSRADGNGGLPSARRGGRGRAGGLSGNLRPRGLCGHAHRRAETEFRLAARNAGARLRRGLPPARHQPALRTGRLAVTKPSAWRRTRIICCAIAGRRS